MKWISNYTHSKDIKFEIVYDVHAGYYFYAAGNKGNSYDGLQDTLEFAKQEALEEFGVPLDSWVQVE